MLDYLVDFFSVLIRRRRAKRRAARDGEKQTCLRCGRTIPMPVKQKAEFLCEDCLQKSPQ